MNNYSNNDNSNDLSGFGDFLNTLNPYEFTIVGVIAAFIIAPSLNPNQQNSIGNFLELVGQTILTISSQEITVRQAQNGNSTSNGEFDDFHVNH